MDTGAVATALDLEEGLAYLDGVVLGHAEASGSGTRRNRP